MTIVDFIYAHICSGTLDSLQSIWDEQEHMPNFETRTKLFELIPSAETVGEIVATLSSCLIDKTITEREQTWLKGWLRPYLTKPELLNIDFETWLEEVMGSKASEELIE